jgi:hypothetical protein
MTRVKISTSLKALLVAFCVLVWVQGAFAHENHTYRIGDKTYQFTVGSLNEAVAVDDKSGLDLRVASVVKPGAEGTPVSGLDQTLKVELGAGGKKKVFNIQPSFGQPGSYRTAFYPTVQTTLTYRIFGTVDAVPIDLTFTCNPAGHPRSPDDNSEVKISDQVTRLAKRGTFGCPVAKADMGFPESSGSSYDLQTKLNDIAASIAEARAASQRAQLIGFIGSVLGLIGLAVAVMSYVKRAPRKMGS